MAKIKHLSPTPKRLGLVDSHPDRSAIIAGLVARVPHLTLYKQFGLSPQVLANYWTKHLAPALAARIPSLVDNKNTLSEAANRQDFHNVKLSADSASTLSHVERKLGRYDRILQVAESEGDIRAWSQVDRAETATLELRARLKGEGVQQAAAPQVIVMFAEAGHQRLDLGGGQVIEPGPEPET